MEAYPPPLLFANIDDKRSRRGSTIVPSSFNTTEHFPMFLLPLVAVLKMRRLRPHQEMTDQLVKYDTTMEGRVIFVSHQWLGYMDPDPQNEQLRVLQGMLRRMLNGEVKVESNWAVQISGYPNQKLRPVDFERSLKHCYIWLDYWSIPQPQVEIDEAKKENATLYMQLAVSSIPSYVERSALVLVLAPTCTHAETGEICGYRTWRRRGWCRLEYFAARLAAANVRVMLIQGEYDQPEFIPPLDLLSLTIGSGDFTCCSRNHKLGCGREIHCDKHKVALVVDRMVEVKLGVLDKLKSDRSRCTMRHFAMLKGRLMRGLGDQQRTADSESDTAVVRLKRMLRWRSEEEERSLSEKTGLTLLSFAALGNNLEATKELLIAQPSLVNIPTRVGSWDFLIQKGMTPLLFAMGFAEFDLTLVLLEAGANPNSLTSSGFDATHSCSQWSTSQESLRKWFERFPDYPLDRRGGVGGVGSINLAVYVGSDNIGVVRALLDAKVDPNLSDDAGGTPLHQAVLNSSCDCDVVRTLLSAQGVDVNVKRIARTFKWRMMNAFARMAVYLGRSGSLVRFIAGSDGVRPLHWAAEMRNVEACRILLEAKADPKLTSSLGMTPLEHASWCKSGKRREAGNPPPALAALFAEYQQ